jgi:CPA1 family monovalent cation:H+ antiporter
LEQLTTILILLFAVSLSGVASLVSRVPLPLLQIGIGIALSALHVHSALDPSLFLLLFVAPLLFVDAYRFPRAEFLSLQRPILRMAVGLVIFTVVGAGYFIHWIIPSMPLAACFALAAVLSPTDAVAVVGSTRGVKIPSRLMHLLEGEALLNDASGLVCFRIAVAAVLTGAFSITNAFTGFFQVSFGGLAVGAFVSFIAMRSERWVSRVIGSHPAAQILLTLLLPFASYLTAERLGFSGILSAVAAGFVGNWVLQEIPLAETRIKSEAITDMVQFTFNGLIFILLGLQLPAIGRSIPSVVQQEGFHSAWILGVFVLGISVFLGVLRFFWSWSSLKWTFYLQRRTAGVPRHTPKRLLLATALAGVRGAITLAAVLSLPIVLNDGSPFPGRELAVLLAAGVILFSLITASVFLPMVMRGVEEPPESSTAAQKRNAQVLAARAAIKKLQEIESKPEGQSGIAEGHAAITSRLVDYYTRRIEALSGDSPNQVQADALRRAERRLRLEALRAERAAINRLIAERALDQEAARALLHKLDNTEAILQNG